MESNREGWRVMQGQEEGERALDRSGRESVVYVYSLQSALVPLEEIRFDRSLFERLEGWG
jgi:hypothetical protein